MGFVTEFRSSLENPQTPLSYPAEWLLDIFNGGRTDSGLRVSEMTALQVTTVFACAWLISGAIGFLPFHIYEQVIGNDKRPRKLLSPDHDLYDLVRWQPNREMTAFTFRRTLQCHALLWGNAYAEIQRDKANRIIAIWPRNPARTRPQRLSHDAFANGERLKAGELVYRTTEGMEEVSPPDEIQEPNSPERYIPLEDMMHIPGLSLDGRLGQDVVILARNAIGLALASEKFGSKFFGNGAFPGGILEHPAKLTPEAREQAKRSWNEAHGGENQQRVALLEQGIKFTPTSVKPNEGQFLETRQFQVVEICRVFGVPPYLVGDTEKMNRANVEQIGLEFKTLTLGPWIETWQQETKRKLLPRPPRGVGRPAKQYIAKFETRQLIMQDSASLSQFLTVLRQWGYGSYNDGREWLDLNPVDEPWADQVWQPVNMQVVGQEDEPEIDLDDPTPLPTPSKPDAKLAQRFVRSYFGLFRDALARVLARSNPDAGDFRRIFLPVVGAIADQLGEMAAAEFNCEPFTVGSSRFVLDYIGGMQQRTASWKVAGIDSAANEELRRCIKALLIETWRAAGATRAKELAFPALPRHGSAAAIEWRHAAPFVLFLARHGESEDDVKGKSSGPNSTPLTRLGELQAQALAAKVALQLPTLAAIVAPDVVRHQQTAAFIAKATGLPVTTDAELDPWRTGELEGAPREELKPYKEDPDSVPPGGESLNTAIARMNKAINRHLGKSQKSGPRLLVLSHKSIRYYAETVLDSNVAYTLKTGGLVATDGDEMKELI